MNASPHRSWVPAALLVGAAYFFIGRLVAGPTHVQAWRLAAWALSAVAFAAHIAYEHFRLRHAPLSTAAHAALAVAVGALALAIAGALHSLSAAPGLRLSWLLAFVAWPVFTAVPAFVVAWVTAAGLRRLSGAAAPSVER
jgi:hypothetical protein